MCPLVTTEINGDGDGTFYLPGGNVVPKKLLKQTSDFSEKVNNKESILKYI